MTHNIFAAYKEYFKAVRSTFVGVVVVVVALLSLHTVVHPLLFAASLLAAPAFTSLRVHVHLAALSATRGDGGWIPFPLLFDACKLRSARPHLHLYTYVLFYFWAYVLTGTGLWCRFKDTRAAAMENETSKERATLTQMTLIFSHILSELKTIFKDGIYQRSFKIIKQEPRDFWASNFGSTVIVPWDQFVRCGTCFYTFYSFGFFSPPPHSFLNNS